MIRCYMAKPWLEVGTGYRAGRLVDFLDNGERIVLRDFLASDHGHAGCLVCNTAKHFRKRRTLAGFIRRHRHCGILA